VKLTPQHPVINREIFAKVLRDLTRLPPDASRLDVEAAAWRSVARHARGMTSEGIAEVSWRIVRGLVRRAKAAA
jgi:hypothetical protein